MSCLNCVNSEAWNGSLGYCEIEGHVVSENYTCDEEEEEVENE